MFVAGDQEGQAMQVTVDPALAQQQDGQRQDDPEKGH
jgi:hypothetical protein